MEKSTMKNSKLPKKSPSASNMMEQLPQKVILHILSRLPLISLLQSKLVCRAWQILIQDPLLITKHFLHMAEAHNDPSFILQSNWPIPDQLYFIDFSSHTEGDDQVIISKKLPNFAMFMCLADSCNGLLCMHNTSQSIYICNPFTRLYIELPKLTKYARPGQLWLGFDPISKVYKVIQIVFQRYLRRSLGNSFVPSQNLIQSEVQILTIGSLAWRNLGMIPYRLIRPTSKVMVNGRLHWLSKPNKYTTASSLISFQLATEQFQEVPKPDCCGSSLDRCFHGLVVLRGCLSAGSYHENYEQLEIWVMKEYGVKESWIKEFSIGTTYVPRTFNQQDIIFFNNSRLHFPNSFVGILCILKSGEMLLKYNGRALVLYDPHQGTFKDLTFPEMPNQFQIVEHIGSLKWLEIPS
ncbi:hypothetical protein COLO4_25857 [Corchorus olitorius]|uniref:F-box domain-containing protein n=1 Tax=Corchorus olitorius TaxID=93759 RepID=A0A1R3HZR3_9ROSI|nr:hypothetical protein COLO4_25857 [Corchorus olitorius]